MEIAGSAGEVILLIQKILKRWDVSEATTDIWFRGVNRSGHPLLPQVYRPKYQDMDQEDLFYRFQVHAAALQTTRPDSWEWYFIAQHYGLPTRLLDWTNNVYTAIYFALAPYLDDIRLADVISDISAPAGDASDPPVIWVLDADHLNKVTVGVEAVLVPGGKKTDLWNPEVLTKGKTVSRVVEGKQISNRVPIALLPPRTTSRIVAQQGVFTIHGTGQKPLDEYYGNKPTHRLDRVGINPKYVRSIWRDLHLSGVNCYSTFPDLPNLAKHIVLNVGAG